MTKYKFDGTSLKDGAKVIANIKGNEIREGNGVRTIGNIKGDEIREGNGVKILFNVKSDDIRQGNGVMKIASMKDVNNVIDGPGKIVKAALWLLCCR